MKIRTLILGALLVLSSGVYGADEVTDETVTADIAATETVDELVEKMTQVQHRYRYRYMNAIKQQLSTTTLGATTTSTTTYADALLNNSLELTPFPLFPLTFPYATLSIRL